MCYCVSRANDTVTSDLSLSYLSHNIMQINSVEEVLCYVLTSVLGEREELELLSGL